MGDVERKWRPNSSHGYSAGLVKEPGVYAGLHTVYMKIADMQGEFGVYNIIVTVCDYSGSTNCRSRQAASGNAAFGAVGTVFPSLVLLLFLLMLAVTMSCRKEFIPLSTDVSCGKILLTSNTEKPGTDFELTLPNGDLVMPTDEYPGPPDWQGQQDGNQHRQLMVGRDGNPTSMMLNALHSSCSQQDTEQSFIKDLGFYRREHLSCL